MIFSFKFILSENYHFSCSDTYGQSSPQEGSTLAPRSSSELNYDSTPKFRQLPCRTFISVGTCPYRERCVYLHDPRIICREAKTKTRRKNEEDSVVDSLFWPVMPYNAVAGKMDSNRQPHVIQPYTVPPPQSDQFYRHDQAVYSMWMHFVDYCSACNSKSEMLVSKYVETACFQAPDQPYNAYTKQARLPVFRTLSQGFDASLLTTTAAASIVMKQSATNKLRVAGSSHVLNSASNLLFGPTTTVAAVSGKISPFASGAHSPSRSDSPTTVAISTNLSSPPSSRLFEFAL
jgi:hypothetical protein